MSVATLGKLFLFLIWPVIFLLIFYFKDKERFKRDAKRFLSEHSDNRATDD